jgi:hypothetical protein
VVAPWLWVCGESVAVGLWVWVSGCDLWLWWLRGCGFLVAVICGCGFMWLWVCGGSVAVGCGLGLWWFGVGLPACDGLLWVDCQRGVVGECGKKNKENELLNCGKQIMKN